jgi:hypothetical protein
MMTLHQMRHGMDTSQCPMIGQTRTMQMTENVRLETYYWSQRHGNTALHICGLVRELVGQRVRYIERETTYSGLQEHRNTNESTERAQEH